MTLRNAFLLCLGLTLAACGERASPPQDAAAPGEVVAAIDPAPAAPAHAATVGATADAPVASATTLQPLDGEALHRLDLPGELGCDFSDAGGDTLLVARADVLPSAPVHGVVRVDGSMQRLVNPQAGGHGDLLDGIALTADGGNEAAAGGLAVSLERGAPMPTGNESSQHQAQLRVQWPDGTAANIEGTWACGP